MRSLLSSLVIVLAITATAMSAPQMTAVTFYAAESNGTVIPSERWNTIAPHPAWDVYVAEGAIPGTNVLNHDGDGEDRHINHTLQMGANTFTFAVSHQPTGDLALDHYGLNVFINGNPQAVLDEAPQISGLVAVDRDGADADDAAEAGLSGNTSDATMGFPLANLPGAGLIWTDGDYTVEMTDYFVYGKYDSTGADNDPDFDVMKIGTNVGPFIADGNQDVVGQFTLQVVPEPASALLLSICGVALLAFRRR